MCATIRTVAVATAFALLAPTVDAQPADTERILEEFGFPKGTVSQVLAGKMVETDLESSEEREIAAGLSFLVKEAPAALAKELREGLLISIDANSQAHGALSGDGTLAQLAALKLGDLEHSYRDAEPGEDLNLSSAEIRAFQALKDAPALALEVQVKKSLLERYRAYRRSGLDGIAPYDRGGTQRSGGADLRSASQALSVVKKLAPAFYDTLLHYPKKPASGFSETFTWQRYKAHGAPVFILTHAFRVDHANGAIVACQRQFYVSGGYNVEQAVAGFLPIPEGTLVVYTNRTSTDQVAGLGGGIKRSLGEKVMASQLEDLFAKLQKAAVQ
jgi:hypothetical protein